MKTTAMEAILSTIKRGNETHALLREAAIQMEALQAAAGLGEPILNGWLVNGPTISANFRIGAGRLHVRIGELTNFNEAGISLTLYEVGKATAGRFDRATSVTDALSVIKRWKRVCGSQGDAE